MAGGITIQTGLIEAAKTTQGEQASSLRQTFLGTLETAPGDLTALYGCHILEWREQGLDAALNSFHRLMSEVPCHPSYVNYFTSHLDRGAVLALADAYIQSHPTEPWGYMIAINIQRELLRFDRVRELLRLCSENTGRGIHLQPTLVASVFDTGADRPYTSLGDLNLVDRVRERYTAPMNAGGGAAGTEIAPRSSNAPETAPQAETKEAEFIGPSGASLNGAVGGSTLPTRYHFRYGQTPDALERETPSRFVPPGRFGHLRDVGENLFRRITCHGYTASFVPPGEIPEGFPLCVASMRLESPFGKDRNHLNGIGAIDLLAGWDSAAHLRGSVPPEYDAEQFPKPAYPGDALDLRDAVLTLTYRSKSLDTKAFYLVAWVHAGTGHALMPETSEDLAAWALTRDIGSQQITADGAWHQLTFTLDCDSRAWSFCGSNTEEMGDEMARYTYHPIGDSLRANRAGNVCFAFVYGSDTDTPEGHLEIGALELSYRTSSLLAPGQQTDLVSTPVDAASLTNGWIGNPDHYWQHKITDDVPLEFVWRLREAASIATLRLHQHPWWPSKEVSVAVSGDGDGFDTIWSGTLDDIPADPSDWPPTQQPEPFNLARAVVLDPPVSGQFIRLRIESGYRDDAAGLDAFEVFGDGWAPLPSEEMTSLSEEISQLEPGTLYAQLVAENAAGRTEGEIVEVPRPAGANPQISGARVIERGETTAAVYLRTNAMGAPATATLRFKDSGAAAQTVSIGKWPASRHAVIQVTGLKAGEIYEVECLTTSEHGECLPYPLTIGPASET